VPGYIGRPRQPIKEDRPAATVSVVLSAVERLKAISAPILPHSAQKLHGRGIDEVYARLEAQRTD
jgi:hypothetical protein